MIHQLYENEHEVPLEVSFMMPVSTQFSLQKIILDITLEDGTKKTVQTTVQKKEKAKVKYDDAIASGKTAIMATMPDIKLNTATMRN